MPFQFFGMERAAILEIRQKEIWQDAGLTEWTRTAGASLQRLGRTVKSEVATKSHYMASFHLVLNYTSPRNLKRWGLVYLRRVVSVCWKDLCKAKITKIALWLLMKLKKASPHQAACAVCLINSDDCGAWRAGNVSPTLPHGGRMRPDLWTIEVTWQDDPGRVHRVLGLWTHKELEPVLDPTQPPGDDVMSHAPTRQQRLGLVSSMLCPGLGLLECPEISGPDLC